MTDKKLEHMQKRRKRGQTYRELSDEFGVPKTTIHRKMREKELEMMDGEVEK